MKKILLIIAVALVVAAAGGWYAMTRLLPPATAADLDPGQARVADTFLDHLDAGRFDEALLMMDARAQAELGQGKLAEIWTTLPKQLGGRKSRSPQRGEAVNGHPVVTSTFEFGYATLDARISFDAQGLIDGFRLVPALAPAAPATMTSNERFAESEFAVGEGERSLGGTLTRPAGAGPFPAVVLVHGSGPHDRDATIGPNRIFRDLAHGLAERGVAVLRFDKRTKVRPQDFTDGTFDVNDEVVDDVVAAIAQLRQTEGIDAARVFVAGHSLGAMMAPRILQRAPDAAGAVLLAAPARPLQAAYLEQIEFLAAKDGSVSEDERAAIEAERLKIDALATLAPDAPAENNLLALPSSYWIDLRDYDPVTVAGAIAQPLLLLQGARDYQVTVAADLSRWREAFADSPRVTVHEYPGLNHLFLAGEGVPNPEEYFTAGHVPAQVIDDIAAWVGRH